MCVYLTLCRLKSFCGFTSACAIITHNIAMTTATPVVLMVAWRKEAARWMDQKVERGLSDPSWKWTVGSQQMQVQSGKACGNVCFSPEPPTGSTANHNQRSGNSGQVLRMYGSKTTSTYTSLLTAAGIYHACGHISWSSCAVHTSTVTLFSQDLSQIEQNKSRRRRRRRQRRGISMFCV